MEITKTIKIDIGEFSNEHSVFIVYNANKYVYDDENRDLFEIKEFDPEDLDFYIDYEKQFRPYVEIEDYDGFLVNEYINIYNQDPEYPIFQTKEEAVVYRDRMQNEADEEDKDNRYKIAKANIAKAILSYYEVIGQSVKHINMEKLLDEIIYRLKQERTYN